jgi:hypothetical protein
MFTTVGIKMLAIWYISSCSLVVYRRFRLRRQLASMERLYTSREYTARCARRLSSSIVILFVDIDFRIFVFWFEDFSERRSSCWGTTVNSGYSCCCWFSLHERTEVWDGLASFVSLICAPRAKQLEKRNESVVHFLFHLKLCSIPSQPDADQSTRRPVMEITHYIVQ